MLDVEYAKQRAPHLPVGWKGDDDAFVADGQLTVPQKTRHTISVKSPQVDVDGDWLLTVEHQIVAHGVFGLTVHGHLGASIRVTIQRARIESAVVGTEKTKTLVRRALSVLREGYRLVATLQGASLRTFLRHHDIETWRTQNSKVKSR